MANENMDDWKATPQVIDETVRVTKKFLEEHPEEVGGSMEPGSKRSICSFLNWPESRVTFSLERLKMIEADVIDHAVIKVSQMDETGKSN